MSSITTNERELMKANQRDWNKHAVAGSRRAGLLAPARGSDSSFLHLLRPEDVVIGYGGGHDA
jgi:hypothetical protein